VSAEREAIVQRRLEKARESLAAAEALADLSYWNASVSRLYYACFYAISALLLRHGLSSSKHSGVQSLFNREFARTSKVPRDLSDFYNNLFDLRLQGDYGDFVRFEEADVRPWIGEARRFVDYVDGLLAAAEESGP
jgi:uncharacterized protein